MNIILEKIVLSLKESFFMALSALRVNKLRSALTLLGIAVGVFSIIGVMTAMAVLFNSIQQGMSELGANTFQVQKSTMTFNDDPQERMKNRNRKNISYFQAQTVAEKTTLAKSVGIEAWSGAKLVKGNQLKTNPNVALVGENVDGFSTNNWSVEDGRMFTQDEFASAKPVAVIGKGVVEKLFPKTDPLGRYIVIDGQQYTVIGTIEDKGSILGDNNTNFIVIPLSEFFRVYGEDRDIHIMVTSSTGENYNDCLEQVRGILRVSRHVGPGADDDFYIFSNESMIAQFNDLTKYVRLGIMLISTIALLAAGVGIMNIMLVSVTERTREIGIRKAIGARKNNVLSQFLIEAVLLSEFGGMIGICIGVLTGNILAIVMNVPPIIPWDWVGIGFGSCSFVGVVFGVYPAWKASNLDPIDALRYE
ncbi:MAG: ABC transporter permease [Bacteroidota bacterium]